MIHSQCGKRLRPLSFLSRILAIRSWSTLRELPDGHLETFREQAFEPASPAIFPRSQFSHIPAVQKWFLRSSHERLSPVSIHHERLAPLRDALVPLEFTKSSGGSIKEFQCAEAPLDIFLEWTKQADTTTDVRLYVAQASLRTLPKTMQNDLPTPDVVAKAGNGDIYDSNLWMGVPPTYTPLHRDPNPNVFVQLAGSKIVRIMPPDVGEAIFSRTQKILNRSRSAIFRGEEMMKGEEGVLLHKEIWDDIRKDSDYSAMGYEVRLNGGDGLFIPMGWWHSIKGIGRGVTASVNWWFR